MAGILENGQRLADQAEVEPPLPESLLELFLRLSVTERGAEFVGTDRAAELLGVSRRTIQLWIELGVIRAVRIGKRYEVSLSSVRDYLRAIP
jgi:excisionase family DNA binding protein